MNAGQPEEPRHARIAGARLRPRDWLAVALAVLGGLLIGVAAARADAPSAALVIDAGEEYYEPREALSYWHGEDADDVALARAALERGAFAPVPRWPPTFGFARGAYWFHLRVRNSSHPDGNWLLVLTYPLLDHADLHVLGPAGAQSEQSGGDRVPFAQRALDDRFPTYRLPLTRGAELDLLLHVRSESSVQVPLAVATPEALLLRETRHQLALGCYYGIMLGLFFYNMILFLSLRDRTFLYYIFYVATFAWVQFTLNGLSFQYLWPRSPDWGNSAVLVSMGFGEIAMLMFSRVFLDLRNNHPAGDNACRILIATLVVAMLAGPWLGYRASIFIETGLVFPVALVIFGSAFKVWFRGFRPAANFLIAWTALLLGVVAYAAVSFGVLPKIFLTEYGIQIGSAAEMILLSFALADRVHLLREENARIQRDAAEVLEHRVEQRTQELNAALEQLKQANQTLREFSLRDGLTGTHNRRYLDRALPDLAARARRERLPLSVVMIDLDNLKRINDTEGHLVGDDCLCAVAQCLLGEVRGEHERVVRYGGEEFVVLLPDVVRGNARERAATLREAVEKLQLKSGSAGLRLTVSIGVATLDGNFDAAAADLLRTADKALYAAKRAGRNQVIAA
jgi:diguanylate cyclase (GGDEF)-like protein